MADAMTLVTAVRDKYCPDPQDEPSDFINIGCCPVERRTSLVLDNSRVVCAGEEEELNQLCPLVEAAHLCGNELAHWKDITIILRSLPKLTFLDLTKNPLSSEEFVSDGQAISTTLSTLALNNTQIEWTAVQNCLKAVPNLVELHLAKNNYNTVGFDRSFSYPFLKRLHIQENHLSDWSELVKLSKAFPQLHTLIASGIPLTKVTSVDDSLFPELVVLGMNNTLLEDWVSFEHLSQLNSLKELNVLRVPVCGTVGDKERRWAIIARIPVLDKLNKSVVSSSEKEEAERWLLREYEGHPEPPPLYADYLDKHGMLDQLVHVDLSPRKTIKLEFHFKDGREAVTRDVKMDQTIGELKKWVACELVGVPSANVQLTYVDCMGWEGMQVLHLNGRKLHTFTTMRDGDQMHVRVYGKR